MSSKIKQAIGAYFGCQVTKIEFKSRHIAHVQTADGRSGHLTRDELLTISSQMEGEAVRQITGALKGMGYSRRQQMDILQALRRR